MHLCASHYICKPKTQGGRSNEVPSGPFRSSKKLEKDLRQNTALRCVVQKTTAQPKLTSYDPLYTRNLDDLIKGRIQSHFVLEAHLILGCNPLSIPPCRVDPEYFHFYSISALDETSTQLGPVLPSLWRKAPTTTGENRNPLIEALWIKHYFLKITNENTMNNRCCPFICSDSYGFDSIYFSYLQNLAFRSDLPWQHLGHSCKIMRNSRSVRILVPKASN